MKINFLNVKKLFFVFVLALAQHVFSQDTIFKRNGEVIASKVLEINTAEIKFRKTSNLTGPVYSEARNEVLRIKFENGVVDTINESAVIKKEVIIQKQNFPNNSPSLKQSLMYKRIGERELLMLIQILPTSTSKNQMLKEYANMVEFRRTQYLSTGLGYAVGFAVPIIVTYAVLVNYNYSTRYDPTTTIIIGALAGAAIRITGQVIAKINKNKRLNAKKNVMLLYDQLP